MMLSGLKKEKYIKTQKRIKNNLSKRPVFWKMFLRRFGVLFVIAIIITGVIAKVNYENEDSWGGYAPSYVKYGEKLSAWVKSKSDYNKDGSMYLNIKGFDSNSQWITSLSSIEIVLDLLCKNPSLLDEGDEENVKMSDFGMIAPINPDTKYTGFWGIYDYYHNQFLDKGPSENMYINILFASKDYKISEAKTKAQSHFLNIAPQQRELVKELRGDVNTGFGSNPYPVSGYICGQYFFIEKYCLANDDTIYKMEFDKDWLVGDSTYVNVEDMKLKEGNIYWGTCEDYYVGIRGAWSVKAEVNEEVRQASEEMLKNHVDYSDIEQENFNSKRYWYIEKFSVGEKYYGVVFTYEYYLFTYIFWSTVVMWGVGLLAAALIISYILTERAYRVQKVSHEIYEYRKMLTNTMAHDLKSPLMVISGYAENLASGNHPEKQEFYTTEIMNSVENINNIIEGILELNKNENIVVKELAEIDLRELTLEEIKTRATDIDSKGLVINVNGNAEIKGNNELIKTVVRNLIDNAIKYSAPESGIEVAMDKKSFTISNPMASEEKISTEDLLKPFVRGDGARTGADGSGLGLTIAKEICDAHGMRISLETKNNQFVVKVSL